jgi:hypothetical protein
MQKNKTEETRQDVAGAFLSALQNHEYEKAFLRCQLTWQSRRTVAWIQTNLGTRDIKKFGYILEEKVSDVCYDLKYYVKYVTVGIVFEGVMILRLICETAPYETDINGTWGVNPITAFGIDTQVSV